MKLFSVIALLMLSACSPRATEGNQLSAQNVGDQLDRAANESTPAARTILENAADQARLAGNDSSLSQPGSIAQNAMQRAGEAASREQGQRSPNRP